MNVKCFLVVWVSVTSLYATAQEATGQQVTAADYQHAEQFLSYNTNPLVEGGTVTANWLTGNTFWYRTVTAKGVEFILVDALRKTKTPAFNQQQLAAALSSATGKTYNAYRLPFQSIRFSDDKKQISFYINQKKWLFDISNNKVESDSATLKNTNPDKEPSSAFARWEESCFYQGL